MLPLSPPHKMLTRQLAFLMGARSNVGARHPFARAFDDKARTVISLMA